MVIFDAGFVLYMVQDNLPAPTIPGTKTQITDCKDRVNHLIDTLQQNKTKIIIPTPALAEALVRSDDAAAAHVSILGHSSHIRVEPFDARAAIEVALMTGAAIKAGDKAEGSEQTWAKVKYDRQIIGIAKANGITTIYARDDKIKTLAEKHGIKVIGFHELPLPPETAQHTMKFFGDADEAPAAEEPA